MGSVAPDDTGSNRNPDGTFKEGVSGNPNGRPKGARSKLSEIFCQELLDDFAENGKAAIETMRRERPQEYSKMIAGILTQEIDVDLNVQAPSQISFVGK